MLELLSSISVTKRTKSYEIKPNFRKGLGEWNAYINDKSSIVYFGKKYLVSLFLKIQLAPELLLSISLLGVINDSLLLGEIFLSFTAFPLFSSLDPKAAIGNSCF